MKEPWKSEPNIFECRFDGYPVIVLRHAEMLHLCGYVGVPDSHPLYREPTEVLDSSFDVHGGITYAGYGKHIKERLEPSHHLHKFNLWWIGFDCAGPGDFVPGSHGDISLIKNKERTYRDMFFVCQEAMGLADQICILFGGCHLIDELRGQKQ